MTALNDFIAENISRELPQQRDYTGPRGWISLCNQILRRIESEGLILLTQKKEVGVEVDNDFWITLPSDYRSGLKIYDPVYDEFLPRTPVPFEIVNGKIKLLTDAHAKDEDPDTYTLSAGGTSSIAINDTDAVANEHEKKLIVLTNGTYSGDSIIIGQHSAAAGGVTTLNFLHARSTSVSTSTTGYLTSMYVMLQYMAQFTGLTASDDDIPVDSRFINLLINGFSYLACTIDSDKRKLYRQEFENDIENLKTEIFTPTPDQARPIPRPMAGLEDCETYPSYYDEFVGDPNAWLE